MDTSVVREAVGVHDAREQMQRTRWSFRGRWSSRFQIGPFVKELALELEPLPGAIHNQVNRADV